MARFIPVLVVFNGVTFLLFAILHGGVPIPLGFVELAEPRIIPATIVEGLCGVAFVMSAFAIFTHRTWAVPATLAAHVIAVAGVLLGMVALAAGRGPRTTTNDIYHRIMLVLLLAGLTIMFSEFRGQRRTRM